MKRALSFLGTKIGIALICFVAIIAAAIFFKVNAEKPPSEKSLTDLAVGKLAEQVLNRENEDGTYKTWEEVSGTSSDFAAGTTTPQQKPNYTSTDLFSQEIFKQYLARKQEGVDIDETTSKEIATDVLSKSYPTDEAPKINLESDFNLVDSGYLSLVAYGNNLVKTLNVPLPKGYTKSEMELLEDIVNDSRLLDKVDFKPLLERYVQIRANLLKIDVPSSAATYHAGLVNAINDFIFAVEGMTTLTSDPIGAIGKTAVYTDGLNLLDLSVAQIRALFKQKGVVYSQSSPAYPFFN